MNTKLLGLNLVAVGLLGGFVVGVTNENNNNVTPVVAKEGPVEEVCYLENDRGSLDREFCLVETLQDKNGLDFYSITDDEGTTIEVTLWNNGNAQLVHTVTGEKLPATFVEKPGEAILDINGKTLTFTF